jgi:Subtilase family
VLLFASTSNDGVITPNNILYPALADEVISVDAADGNGEPANFNPSSVLVPGKERFTAPGIGIPSPISEQLMDGTSFASPIAAGVAGLVLEFAHQYPLTGSASVLSCLRERHGMVLILRKMSKQKGVDQFSFLCPWELLGDVWGVYGGEGEEGSRRRFVAQEIVYHLRNGFGGTVGADIFPVK